MGSTFCIGFQIIGSDNLCLFGIYLVSMIGICAYLVKFPSATCMLLFISPIIMGQNGDIRGKMWTVTPYCPEGHAESLADTRTSVFAGGYHSKLSQVH